MKRASFIVVLLFVSLALQSVTVAAQPSRPMDDSPASSAIRAPAGFDEDSEFWPYLHSPLQEVTQVVAGSRQLLRSHDSRRHAVLGDQDTWEPFLGSSY